MAVIIVEKTSMIRLSISTRLKQVGYMVYDFESVGQWLLHSRLVENTDLLVLGTNRLGDESFQALRQVRSHDLSGSIPVLLISSEARVEYVKEIVELGVSDFMVKPIDHEVLVKRVQSLLPLRTVTLEVHELISMELAKAARGNNYSLSVLFIAFDESHVGQRIPIIERFKDDCRRHLRITDLPFVLGEACGLLLPFADRENVAIVTKRIVQFMEAAKDVYTLPTRMVSVSYPSEVSTAHDLMRTAAIRLAESTPFRIK